MATAKKGVPPGSNQVEKVTEAMFDAIERGLTIKDIQGVSSETMDGIYRFAYDFYQQGRLNDAEVFFRFLCIYDFYNADYAMGLAAVCQLKKNYAKAIDLYALAFALSKHDYRPMFYTGQCQLMRGKAALARECFRTVVEHSDDERLRQMAASYLQGLEEIGVGVDRKQPASELKQTD
jgi:type III secretion system low calcium response chaperone LcrH/SycD